MKWERDRLLLALADKALQLSTRPKTHAELLYKSYADYYRIDFVSEGLAKYQALTVTPSIDFDLVAHRYEPSACAPSSLQVLLLHGYFDHGGLYRNIIEYLLKRGISVVALDLPGHGLSSGKRTSIEHFYQYQEAVKAVMSSQLDSSKPVTLIGQSMGAGIVADFVSSNDCAAFRRGFKSLKAVMLAPLLRPLGWNKAEFMHSLLKGRKDSWPRDFKDNSHDEAFLKFVQEEDPLQSDVLSVEWVGALREWVPQMESRGAIKDDIRVIIIQGTDDTTVDWEFNLDAYRRLFPLAKVITIDGAGHHLVGESEEYRTKVFAVLDKAF